MSFVHAARGLALSLGKNHEAAAKAFKTAIELATAFEMQSTAEGVDSLEVLDELAVMNCDIVQGYFIARPMRVEALERWFGSDALSRLERSIANRRRRADEHNLGHLASRR